LSKQLQHVATRSISSSAASSSAPTIEEVSISNPLLGIDVAPKRALTSTPKTDDDARRFHYKVKRLPVGPKKIYPIANLTRRLYWREAMLQMEFCRRNFAVHIKNAISDAVKAAEQKQGFELARTLVDQIVVGKGTYLKEIDYKAKGRFGIRSKYESHLYIILKEASENEISSTKFYSRWRKTAQIIDKPWEERIKDLPRYRPIPGYEPGEFRLRDPYALTGPPALDRTRSEPHRGNNRNRKGRRLAWSKPKAQFM